MASKQEQHFPLCCSMGVPHTLLLTTIEWVL